MRVQGVEITESDLEWLNQRAVDADSPSRSCLSRQFCERKGLVDLRGRPREVTARKALLKLHQVGAVSLPASRGSIPKHSASLGFPDGLYGGDASECGQLGEIEVLPVFARQTDEHLQWRQIFESYHPLGAGPLCGAQLRYLVRCEEGLLGGLAFSACARRLASRDEWIGWRPSARDRNLQLVVNNSRFALAPRVRNLASHVLSRCVSRLPEDWYEHYGYSPLLVETFVDRTQYEGSCYRAAGWISIGSTTGRGRQDRDRTAEVRPKEIFVYPLDLAAKSKLCVEPIVELSTDGDWVEQEFASVELGDERLAKRLHSIVRDFSARPLANIPQACGSTTKTKAAYRFYSHPEVTMDAILEPHYEASLSRAAKEDVVLALQDTTSLNYTKHPAVDGLGPIGSFGAQATLGLHVHTTLLANTAGTPLGLLDVECWARDSEPSELTPRQIEKLPIEDKESYKWLQGYMATERAQRRLEKTRLVNVCDREGDVFELFDRACEAPGQPDLLVRAVQSRKIEGSDDKLWERVQKESSAGTLPLSVPRSGKRPRRKAILDLKFAEVSILPPRTSRCTKPVRMWAVIVTEIEPPTGVAAIEWKLLTTLPVKTAEEASEKVAWYAMRWQIEVYFRTLKSGCRIETRQLKTAHGLKSCLAVDMVVAWRVFHLVKLGREVPDLPCDVFFEESEWKALVCFLKKTREPPSTPPTLKEAIRMAASLGGFLGRKSDGDPGTQTLWLGLQRLDDIAAAFGIFLEEPPDTS